jgi:hypothetical protein
VQGPGVREEERAGDEERVRVGGQRPGLCKFVSEKANSNALSFTEHEQGTIQISLEKATVSISE